MMKHYGFALLAFVVALSTAWAQPGALDPAFATKGLKKFTFHHNMSDDQGLASVKDASGNLYVAGFETGRDGSGIQNPFVVKILPSGKLDPNFGTAGKSVFLGGNSSNYFYPSAITLQSNGKIVLAGYYRYFETPYASVVRLNADGSLDKDFASGGYYQYYNQSGYTSVVIANNKIFATGGTYTPTDLYADFIISAFDTTGTIVNIKGSSAPFSINFSTSNGDYANSSVLDGDILYLGGTTMDASGSRAFGYSAFNTKTMDTVALQGNVLLPIVGGTSGTTNTCTAVKVTANHELLLGGFVAYSSGVTRDFLLYKINAAGQIDSTFGAGGYQTYQVGSNLYSAAATMLLDGNNVLLAGSSNANYMSPPMWGAIRVNTSNGALDGTFSSVNLSSIQGSGESITSITKSNDGNYYFVGTWNSTVSNSKDALVKKVTLTGANATGFGTGSQVTTWIEDYDGIVTDLVKRSDGKFWISGYYIDPVSGSKYGALALLNSDGTTDTTTVKGNGDAANGDVGIINIATLMQAYSGFQNTVVSTIELETAGTLLVAGTYTDSSSAFLIRLGTDGKLQTAFNNSLAFNSIPIANSYPHKIIVQPDNNILVSGYAHQNLAVARFTNLGLTDASFGNTTGVFIFADVVNPDLVDIALNYVPMKLQSDGKIVVAGSYNGIDSFGDFLVFRLTSTGALDNTGFGTGGFYTYSFITGAQDFAMALTIKPNGQILAGGLTNVSDGTSNYAMLQLNSDGTLDSTFGNNTSKGTFIYAPVGYNQSVIKSIDAESANAIVMSGIAGIATSDYYFTALRITAAGKLDPTFNGQGHEIIAPGYNRTARLYNGQLYIVGGNNPPMNMPVVGQIARLNLGTGPVIKSTNLKLPDHLNVTYGDEPFKLQPTTNSYAPITYSVTYGAYQGSVDPTTGLVKIKVVPGDDYPLQIQAYQPAVVGYTEATASVKIYISRGLPQIVFNDQGGIVGDTIRLSFQTNADTSYGYSYSIASPDFQMYTRDSVIILGESSAPITLNLNSSQNYDYAYATATIHGYVKPIPPVAADDDVELIQGLNQEMAISVLANDQAYTGRIVPGLIDLDPSTKATDSTYFSSALGAFKTDKAGFVHFIPFQGLIGSGEIYYTITDSRGDVSAPAKISVNVKILGQRPALKATELVTPNNDGLNDAFVIGYVDIAKENTLKIFDRNGQVIFTKNNYQNDWRGELEDGKTAENGIYFFTFRENDGDNTRELKGAVELRR